MAYHTFLRVQNNTTQNFNGLLLQFDGLVWNLLTSISAFVVNNAGSNPWPQPYSSGPINSVPPKSFLKFGISAATYMNVAPGNVVEVHYNYPNNCLYPINGSGYRWMMNGIPKAFTGTVIYGTCFEVFLPLLEALEPMRDPDEESSSQIGME